MKHLELIELKPESAGEIIEVPDTLEDDSIITLFQYCAGANCVAGCSNCC